MISSIPSVTSAQASGSDASASNKRAAEASNAATSESAVVNLSESSARLKSVLDYLPADANQDGAVGELERRAYDLEHPAPKVKTPSPRLAGEAVRAYQLFGNGKSD